MKIISRTLMFIVSLIVLGIIFTFSPTNVHAYPDAYVSGGTGEANVYDDNYATYWQSASTTTPPNYTQWIYIDYGSPQTFNTVSLLWGVDGERWESDYAQSFNLQVSTNNVNWTNVYTTDNGGKGLFVIPIEEVIARYLKVEATELGEWDTEWGTIYSDKYMIAEISHTMTYPAPDASSDVTGYEPYKTLDDDLATGWRSDGVGNQNITFDYNESVNLCYMTLLWGNSYASSYTVEMSQDSVVWDEVYSTESGDGGVDEFWLQMDWVYDETKDDYLPKSYQYVRVKCTTAGSGTYYEIKEFDLLLGRRSPQANASEAWSGSDSESYDDKYRYCPSMVTDGSLDGDYGRWESGNYAKEQTLYVDLGSEQTFSEMKLYWNNGVSNCDDYTVYGSTNGISWNSLDTVTSPNVDVDEISFSETTARFIKLELSKDLFFKQWTDQQYSSSEEFPFSVKEVYIIPGALATSCWNYEWGTQSPFKGVDKDMENAWTSVPPWGNMGCEAPSTEVLNNQSIYIDYEESGSGKTFDTVILQWTDWYAKSYSVEISTTHITNGPWTQIYSTTTGDGDADVIFLENSETAKYLQVKCTERGDTTVSYALKEVIAEMKGALTVIDYGSPKTFNKVSIYWNELQNDESFRVKTSTDQVTWTTRYTTDNAGKGREVVPVGTISARYVKIECTDNSVWGTPWSAMIGEVKTYLEYPYETVTDAASGYEAYKARDGDLATAWRSDGGGEKTFLLTYPGASKICFVTLVWGAVYPSSYTIEAYDPDSGSSTYGWNTVYTTTEGNGGVDDMWLDIGWYDEDPTDNDWNYSPTTYDKLRLTCTNPVGGSYYEIREFRVTFGNQYPQVYASKIWKQGDVIEEPDLAWKYCPGFVVNGGLEDDYDYSRWATGNYTENQWLYIDFGKNRTFDEMNIYWYDDHGCDDYTVFGSQNGISWTQLIDKTSTTGDVDVLEFTEATARFLKVKMDNIVDRPYSIKEIYIIPGLLSTSCRADEWGPQVPYKALDGDLTTCWSSVPPWGNWGYIPEDDVLDNQSITIDYGEDENTFNTIIMQWDGGHAKAYSFKTSDSLSTPEAEWTTIYYSTNTYIIEDGGTDLIKFDSDITTQFLKVCCTTRKNSDSNYTIQEVITELRTRYPFATASSEQSQLDAANAVDNSDQTRWSSDWVSTAWITIDYGALRRFDEIRLLWESAYAISYQIQISDDNSDWTSIYSTTSGNGGEDIIELQSAVTGRYVKLTGTERALPNYGYSLWDFSTELTTQPVQLTGKRLTVEGDPFFAKGVCYGGTPVGQNHNYDWSGHQAMYDVDMELLEDMGCNSIRLYKTPLYAAGMDAAYRKGIYVLMGYDIAQDSDIMDVNVRNAYKAHFEQMVTDWKDHPAVFMWSIANEMNVHVYKKDIHEGVYTEAQVKSQWYSLVNDCAASAKQIEGDNFHPVTTVGVEVGDIFAGSDFGTTDAQMTNLDVWSVNIYRGQYFWNLFALGDYEVDSETVEELVTLTNKPVLITEFGCDAYHTFKEELFDEPQAEFSRNWWIDMLGNASSLNSDKPSLGGMLFQYADDWNKQKNPGGHDKWPTGFCGNLFDSRYRWDEEEEKMVGIPNWEDEWAGIVGISEGTCNKSLRAAYYSLQTVWAAPVYSDNFATNTTASYSWYGSSYTYNGTDDWINTYGANGSVSMTKALNSVDSSVQADFCFTTTTSGKGAIRAFVRATPSAAPGTDDGYCAIVNVDDSGQVYSSLYRINDGAWHYLADSNTGNYRLPETDEWHTIKFSVRDTTLTLFMDGSYITNYRDDSAQAVTSAGDVSIQPMYGNAYIDNYFAIKCGYGKRFDEAGNMEASLEMDENVGYTVVDYSENDNQGVITGAQWTSGINGAALEFDGVNDYVEIANSTSLDITDEITVEAWVYAESGGQKSIVGKWVNSSGNRCFALSLYDTKPRFTVHNGVNSINVTFNTAMSLNEWHHLVGVFKPGEYIKVYVDSVSKKVNTSLDSIQSSTTPVRIGKDDLGSNYFEGIINAVRLYHYAMGDTEVSDKYESIVFPVGLWSLNENTGSSAYDYSNNDNDGTITSATWTTTGINGSALYFDGTNDYVQIANSTSLNITDEISVEAWVCAEAGGEKSIVGKWVAAGGSRCFALSLYDTKPRFTVHDGINSINVTFDTALSLNKWYHLVGVFKPGEYVMVYVNGVAKTASTTLTSIESSTVAVRIGKDDLGSNYFDGKIDAVAIYDFALTEQNIMQKYNLFKPITAYASTEQGSNTADRAVDGNYGLRWESESSDPQWIYVDLGRLKKIHKVTLDWEGAYGESYQIQKSEDASTWTDVYSTTTGDGGEDLINLDNLVSRYVRMYGTERGTGWGYSLWEFAVDCGQPEATASSQDGTDVVPNRAIDKDFSTRWCSEFSDPQWIRIDFRTAKTFNTVKLSWESAYGKAYVIQKSDNGTSWTTIFTETDGDGGEDLIDVGSQTSRYIRMYGTERGTGWGYSLWEFEVY